MKWEVWKQHIKGALSNPFLIVTAAAGYTLGVVSLPRYNVFEQFFALLILLYAMYLTHKTYVEDNEYTVKEVDEE